MRQNVLIADPRPETGLLDAVREGFAFVAQNAEHVRIREDRLEAYARELPDKPPANLYDREHHFIATAEATTAYTLILNVINFGSGYKDDLAAEGWNMIDHSIYYSVSTALKHWFEKRGGVPASALSTITAGDMIAMLGLPDGPHSREFAGLCAQNLREFGALLCDEHEGSYMRFLDAAHGSAEAMAATLVRLPNFRDEHAYKGQMVPFYKRAQITAGELNLAFGKLGITLFHDLDRLTMFADNGVPHVLRMDGILEYDTSLATRIDTGQEILAGSDEETEIRGCAGHAVELIARLKGQTATDIDFILWHRSVEGALYQTRLPHRTRTIFY